MRRTIPALIITAVALGAIAVFPSYVRTRSASVSASSLPTPAPLQRDYLERGQLIHFWEGAVAEHHYHDMMSPRILSGQYLQRYREQGDIDDVLRARRSAQLSLEVQPRANLGAESALAGVDLTLHRFREALALTKDIESYLPGDQDVRINEASLDLELGRYGEAKAIIDTLPAKTQATVAGETLLARWDELTGNLARARRTFERATAFGNARFDDGAQQRAWFYFRAGELAFEAGDNDAALEDERKAVDILPSYSDALRAAARFTCALHEWQPCLDFAQRSAAITPYPETLGYEADAQDALGEHGAAVQTRDLIGAVERIGNAQHISDRLLATYYADHRVHTDDAFAIARRELTVRDDIFTEDTLAWAAAMDGRWAEARVAITKALRFQTENSLLHYHAGVIALHFGDRAQAKQHFEQALALNPHFHQTFADQARQYVAQF
jgi:tetratricopeptide (TPR) repeat protein